MKKIHLLACVMFLPVIFLACASSYTELEVGMSYTESLQYLPETAKSFDVYTCFTQGDENIVVEYDGLFEKIVQIRSFDAVFPSEEDFSKVTPQMSFLEVVEQVGIPKRSVTFGISSTDFESAEGTYFRIIWDSQMKVYDVSKLD